MRVGFTVGVLVSLAACSSNADALAAGCPPHEGAFDYAWRPDGVTWPPL